MRHTVVNKAAVVLGAGLGTITRPSELDAGRAGRAAMRVVVEH